MKTMLSYIVGAAIAFSLAGTPIQTDIFFDSDFLDLLIILSIGTVLAIIAELKGMMKSSHRILTGN